MRALVTGGAGFIGSNLVRALAMRGATVTVLDDLSTGCLERIGGLETVRFVKGDVRDQGAVLEAMDGAEIVFHLAASVGNIRSLESALFDSEVNILGTLQVLEAARRLKVKKVIYSSSAAIFGEPVRVPIEEDHPVNPDSPYGVSKLAGEKHCLCYMKVYGLKTVCLRYFNVYGAFQDYDAYGNVIPIFANLLLRGEPLTIYGDGEQTRDFVNVADVVQANLLAAKVDPSVGTFNVGSGGSITINRLAALMQRATGVRTGAAHLSARKGEVRHSVAEVGAARRTLGYSPAVGIEEGLTEYLDWLRPRLALVGSNPV